MHRGEQSDSIEGIDVVETCMVEREDVIFSDPSNGGRAIFWFLNKIIL